MSELRWTKEAIGARVDQLAGEHQGDEFIEACRRFSEQLSDKERGVLQDVLMAKANLRGRIREAARQRRQDAWLKRMMDGRFSVRRRRP